MDAMREIGEKIAEKRKEKGWTQKELAEKLYVSDKNVSKWECGRSVPDVFMLKRMADLFGVKIEYFVKLEGDGDFMTDVGIKIRSCREIAGYSQAEFAERLRTTEKNVIDWENGEALPDIFYLNKMSELFDFPLEELIGFDAIERTDVNAEKRTRAGKISFTLLLIFALAPLLVTVIARIFLPETVPCHFDADWTVTRWGSSKELVIMGGSFFCIISTAAVALCYAFVKIDNAEIRQWTVWLAFGVFAAMAVAMTAIGADIVKRCYDLALAEGYTVADYSKFNELFSVIIVVLFAVCGALCIFVPQNAVIGVRIPYSYKGKEEWAFVNGVTGAVMYVVSVAMLVTIGSVDGPAGFGLVGAAIFVPVVVTLVAAFASVKLHKKIKADKKRERELFK